MKKKILCAIITASMLTAVPVYAKDITVTIPDYGDQENDASVPDAKKTTVNPDGSTTYTLDNKQQKKWKKELKSSFDDYIKEILDDDTNYPNVENITYNKTDSPNSATSFYNIKAYQNGIELAAYAGTGNSACDNTYKTVLKDTSIETGFAFMLQDTESPITVYVYDGFMSDSPCQIQEIAIK